MENVNLFSNLDEFENESSEKNVLDENAMEIYGEPSEQNGQQPKELWTKEEAKWLLDHYSRHENEIGRTNLFRTKKELHLYLSREIEGVFNRQKTEQQISNRIQTILRHRKMYGSTVLRSNVAGCSNASNISGPSILRVEPLTKGSRCFIGTNIGYSARPYVSPFAAVRPISPFTSVITSASSTNSRPSIWSSVQIKPPTVVSVLSNPVSNIADSNTSREHTPETSNIQRSSAVPSNSFRRTDAGGPESCSETTRLNFERSDAIAASVNRLSTVTNFPGVGRHLQSTVNCGSGGPVSSGTARLNTAQSDVIAACVNPLSSVTNFPGVGRQLQSTTNCGSDGPGSCSGTARLNTERSDVASCVNRLSNETFFPGLGRRLQSVTNFCSGIHSSSALSSSSNVQRPSTSTGAFNNGLSTVTSPSVDGHFELPSALSSSSNFQRASTSTGGFNNGLSTVTSATVGGHFAPTTLGAKDIWPVDQSRYLLDQYYLYSNEVGPMKLFRNKQSMWLLLTNKINSTFGTNITDKQVTQQFNKLIQKKKDTVDKNKVSGAVRTDVEFQEELAKIAAIDDSIEPEVLRGINYVKYKKSDNKNVSKPRWDKPTKKDMTNMVSQTLLSVEERRIERDAEKDRLRDERHKRIMEVLESLKKN